MHYVKIELWLEMGLLDYDLSCDSWVWLNYTEIQRKCSVKIDIKSIKMNFEATFLC